MKVLSISVWPSFCLPLLSITPSLREQRVEGPSICLNLCPALYDGFLHEMALFAFQ